MTTSLGVVRVYAVVGLWAMPWSWRYHKSSIWRSRSWRSCGRICRRETQSRDGSDDRVGVEAVLGIQIRDVARLAETFHAKRHHTVSCEGLGHHRAGGHQGDVRVGEDE